MQRHVRVLAHDIGERNVYRPAALHAAAAYIGGEFAALGLQVNVQSWKFRDVPCSNLEVEIAGPVESQRIVLVGAHYDTVQGSPGADDNASGVTGLIEMARGLRHCCPAQTIRLVAFVPGVAWSDQLFFWRQGYNGVMVTDTAFYRYPYYHTASDTPDKLNYREMAGVVKGLADSIALLARVPSSEHEPLRAKNQ